MPFQQKQCDYWVSGRNLDLMPEAYLNLVSPQSWNTIRKSDQISLDPGMVYLPILTIKNQLNLGKPFKSTSNFCLEAHLILPSFTVWSFAPYICHCTGCLLATKESHSIGSSYNGSNLGESRWFGSTSPGFLGVWVEWKIGMWNGRNIYEIMTVQTGGVISQAQRLRYISKICAVWDAHFFFCDGQNHMAVLSGFFPLFRFFQLVTLDQWRTWCASGSHTESGWLARMFSINGGLLVHPSSCQACKGV